jgi:hypothetical protein
MFETTGRTWTVMARDTEDRGDGEDEERYWVEWEGPTGLGDTEGLGAAKVQSWPVGLVLAYMKREEEKTDGE